jgi:hypothetical protein
MFSSLMAHGYHVTYLYLFITFNTACCQYQKDKRTKLGDFQKFIFVSEIWEDWFDIRNSSLFRKTERIVSIRFFSVFK